MTAVTQTRTRMPQNRKWEPFFGHERKRDCVLGIPGGYLALRGCAKMMHRQRYSRSDCSRQEPHQNSSFIAFVFFPLHDNHHGDRIRTQAHSQIEKDRGTLVHDGPCGHCCIGSSSTFDSSAAIIGSVLLPFGFTLSSTCCYNRQSQSIVATTQRGGCVSETCRNFFHEYSEKLASD